MGTTTQLKSRLRRIVSGIPGNTATRIGMLAAGLVVIAGLGVTASTAIAEAADSSEARHGTVIKGDNLAQQDPAEMKPRTIALNGVDIETPEAPAAPEAPATPVAPTAPAAPPAPPAPPAAYASAEAAREAAEAAAEHAQAEAERAREVAEAARERAEAAREKANDAAEAAADAAADAADQVSDSNGVDVKASCKSARSRQVLTNSTNGNRLSVVVCDKAIATFTNARTETALKQARAQIAAMTELSAQMRAKALEGLDKAIARMKARGVGGYSMQ